MGVYVFASGLVGKSRFLHCAFNSFYDCVNISGFALVNTVRSGPFSKFVVNAGNE